MIFDLSKGNNFNLSKEAATLIKLRVGLQWDKNPNTKGAKFDLDATAYLTGPSGKVMRYTDFVWYKTAETMIARGGAIQLLEDNTDGGKVGDDETILIDLARIPADITSIFFGASIHEADKRGQNFGQVPKASIRLLDDVVYGPYFAAYEERNKIALAANVEPDEPLDMKLGVVAKYDLQEDFSTETAVLVAELYRHPSGEVDANGKEKTDWKFRAIGQGIEGGLMGLINRFEIPSA